MFPSAGRPQRGLIGPYVGLLPGLPPVTPRQDFTVGPWLVSRGAPFSQGTTGLQGLAAGYNVMWWVNSTFPAAQFSEMMMAAGNPFYCNTAIRASGEFGLGTWSCYLLVCNPGADIRVERWENNAATSPNILPAWVGPIPGNLDWIRIQIDAGYNLSVYVNGVLRSTATDGAAPAVLAGGTIGPGVYDTNSRIAQWRGGSA